MLHLVRMRYVEAVMADCLSVCSSYCDRDVDQVLMIFAKSCYRNDFYEVDFYKTSLVDEVFITVC